MFVAKKQVEQAECKKPKPVLLVFPFGHLSHYLRCLMLAKHFSAHFDVRFSHHDAYAPFVEREHFATFNCLSPDAGHVLECVKRFDFSWINERSLEPVYQDQVKNIELLKPVAVLGDTSPTLKMAAEKTGVFFISLVNGYMSKYYANVRKLSRTHRSYPVLNIFPRLIMDWFAQAGEYVAFQQVHKPFRKIRERQGLCPVTNYLNELEGDLNLVCDLPELFPQKLLPPRYMVISPLFYEADTGSSPLLAKLDKTKKTIYVSMGSTGDWDKVGFLNDAAFQKYNVVAAGDARNALHAAHIFKTDFANAKELFPFTDLVICHGGNGTIYQSLAYGIPVLCGTSHFEQEWNVDAIEKFGLGKSLDGLSQIHQYVTLVEQWIAKKPGTTSEYASKIRLHQQGLPDATTRITGRIMEYGDTAFN